MRIEVIPLEMRPIYTLRILGIESAPSFNAIYGLPPLIKCNCNFKSLCSRRDRDERDVLRAVVGGRSHVARAVLPAPAQERPHPGGHRQRRLELGGRGHRRILLLARLHRQHRDDASEKARPTKPIFTVSRVTEFAPEMKLLV